MKKFMRKLRKHEKIVRAAVALVVLGVARFVFEDAGIVYPILCGVSALLAGGDVLSEAVVNIFHGEVFDENFLMCIAAVGAFFIGEYPEAAAVMIFYQVGEYFQQRAVGKSRASISALMDIRPDIAHLVGDDGTVRDADPSDVAVGQMIEIRPGERVPVDAKIVEGQSWLDTSALSGESVPREVRAGDEIFGGSVNTSGLLTARVERVFAESAVSRMLELVENASDKKAKAENFITSFARWYTPTVVGLAAALAILPPIFAGHFSDWLYRALVFLVVSCPCALVISVPLGFFGGIGGAAGQGVMVKGGNYMETLAGVDTVLMDKTGTLTRGSFDVQRVEPKGMTEDELVDLVAHAEMVSPHPMAKAVLTYYGKQTDASRIGAAEEIAGCGARALVDGHVICAGRRTWIAEITGEEIAPADYAAIYVAVDGKYAGFIEVADAVKPDAKQAVADLKKAGVKRVVMLTGDNEAIARRVAAELGIDEVHAELLPDGKVDCAEKIMQESGTTAFVGDGINDAPLLARADVGIAMGALGSDAAIEAADVVIMNDEPSRIALAMAIARKTMAIVRGNVVLSLAVKFAVLVLAALGVVGMWTAVFADVGVAMLAILNSMRTLRFAKKVR